MEYYIVIILIVSSLILNKLKTIDFNKFENKLIIKFNNDNLMIKLVKSWFKLFNLSINLFDNIINFMILSTIYLFISEKVGQFEAIAFLLIGISVKLSLLLSKK